MPIIISMGKPAVQRMLKNDQNEYGNQYLVFVMHKVSHLYCAMLYQFVLVYHPVCHWESHLQSLKASGLFICDQFVCVYVFVYIPSMYV